MTTFNFRGIISKHLRSGWSIFHSESGPARAQCQQENTQYVCGPNRLGKSDQSSSYISTCRQTIESTSMFDCDSI